MTRTWMAVLAAISLAGCSGDKPAENRADEAPKTVVDAPGSPAPATPAAAATAAPKAAEPARKPAEKPVIVLGSKFSGDGFNIIGDQLHMPHFGVAKAEAEFGFTARKVVADIEGWELKGEYPVGVISIRGITNPKYGVTLLNKKPVKGKGVKVEEEVTLAPGKYSIEVGHVGSTDDKTRSRIVLKQIQFLP